MTERLKRAYARWLFKRYGFNRGLLFENIPLLLRMCPLFSPSCYGMEEGRFIAESFIRGVESCTDTITSAMTWWLHEGSENDAGDRHTPG